MKRIRKFAAIGISSLMATVVLAPAALAAGGVRAGTGASVPTTHIKGKPAKFSPSKLTVTSKWDGVSKCTASQASFEMLNNENKTETVKFYINGGLFHTETIAAHKRRYICSKKGIGKYTAVGKLSDGKKLTVKFT